jgi:hypothetical protein
VESVIAQLVFVSVSLDMLVMLVVVRLALMTVLDMESAAQHKICPLTILH